MDDVETLLTIRDVQKRLAIGRDATYQLIASGELPSIRIGAGRLIRVRPQTLDAWLQSAEQGSTDR